MSILYKLASSLGRRDVEPNQKLALQIIERNDKLAIVELIENTANRNENIQADCIEVLCEIGKYKPIMIMEFDNFFIQLLSKKNQNLVLGGLEALDYITVLKPDAIYVNLRKIMEVADSGLIISKEHGLSILLQLASVDVYAKEAFSIFLNVFENCALNLYVKYAEKAVLVIKNEFKPILATTLKLRLSKINKNDSKKNRLENVIHSCELTT
jgi:hypothetical protein